MLTRQPRAVWRRAQAVGRLAASDAASRPRRRVREHRALQGAHRRSGLSTWTPSCVLVLKNCGPKGYPGMAEVGNMGLPPKVLQTGVTDMVRISDARMSGTAYGTACCTSSPEAAVGGPLALVQDGDMIELDVAARPALQLDGRATRSWPRRRAAWRPPRRSCRRAATRSLYIEHVQQADTGRRLRLPGRLPWPQRVARIALIQLEASSFRLPAFGFWLLAGTRATRQAAATTRGELAAGSWELAALRGDMKLLRYGPPGQEKPGLLDDGNQLRDLSGVVPDIAGARAAAGVARPLARARSGHAPARRAARRASGHVWAASASSSASG